MATKTIADRYVLLTALGRGGFGEVWRAQDSTLGREVAVKVVDLGVIGDPPQLSDIVARFRREALAVGGLRHANIVSAFDAGRAGDTLYLVMELVPGSSLADLIENRQDQGVSPMPVAEVIDIALQVCAGLASAHAAGVVHRDIKPANLMVDPDRIVKIIDFGIARFTREDMPRLTAPGSGVGTLSYVAPEQAQGLPVDGRADLYSLGCMLYELLAGVRPFVAHIPVALLNKQLSERAAPLRTHRPDVPPRLEALVAQLMEKEPAARPATAQEVHDRLTAIRRDLMGDGPARDAAAAGAQDAPAAQAEAGRPTVLAGDRPNADSGYRPTVLADQAASHATIDAPARQGQRSGTGIPTATAGGPGRSSPPGIPAAPPRPPGWGQAGPGREAGRAQRPPGRPRARARSLAFAAALLGLVVAAGVITAVALRGHGSLAVTAVAVAPATPPAAHRCHETVRLVGTIITNGRGGTVTYQWTRSDGTTSPVQSVRIANGSRLARVLLRWSFRGRGTTRATATLRVLSPSVRQASSSFTYSCR